MPSNSRFPTLGILGGGQLGRMTAFAAIRMGVKVRFLSPDEADSVEQLGDVTVADWNDPGVLSTFASGCDVVTLENEWAPVDLLERHLPPGAALWPSARTISLIRDKGVQKKALYDAGLPLPPFECCPTVAHAHAAAEAFGYPVVMKRYRGSYDGYGNATVRQPEEIEPAYSSLCDDKGVLVEAWVPFVRELAALVVRSPSGEKVVYPIAHTEQRDHRCHAVVVPAGIREGVARECKRIALEAAEAVGSAGILAVELFELHDGRVLINELAPRPHNTGHYSIEACHTSQFENHVRAVLGWPLGDPGLREPVAVMVNILGRRSGTTQPEGLAEALSVQSVNVHIYGKKEVRPKRKMGHITATGIDVLETRGRAEHAASMIIL